MTTDKMRLKQAPDWFGCGRVITQQSWNGFLAAQRAYYARKDKEIVNVMSENTLKTDPIGLVDNSLLLTPREVAARLKVSLGTVRAWVKDGKLVPAVKLPRTRRFLWVDVQHMLTRAAEEAAKAAMKDTDE